MSHIYITCKSQTVHHSILQNDILELICSKDSHIVHSVAYHIKKIYSMWDYYTVKIIKSYRKMLKIDM